MGLIPEPYRDKDGRSGGLITPGARDDAAQISVALIILGQQRDVAAAVDQRNLSPKDRLDTRLPGGLGEARRAVQRIMIRQGDGGHIIFRRARDQCFGRRHAIEQRVIGMGV